MNSHLPTGSFAQWDVTAFKDSLISTLKDDHEKSDAKLRLYFYAVTMRGWDKIRGGVLRWMKFDRHRKVVAYVGTDHAITDPRGLEAMRSDGIAVRIMENYRGVFHPKVVWLDHPTGCRVWIGSNNLTRDGLLNNIEFAATIQSDGAPKELRKWADKIHAGSATLTKYKLESYRVEREKFEQNRIKSGIMAFTWSSKNEPTIGKRAITKGDLVLEIMPRETGGGGKQIQIPVQAAREFFELEDSKVINLKEKGNPRSRRKLTLTLFGNRTVRLVINELEYRDRPCVVLFHKIRSNRYNFEIISEFISPRRYKHLLGICDKQTSRKSRRWGIAKKTDIEK